MSVKDVCERLEPYLKKAAEAESSMAAVWWVEGSDGRKKDLHFQLFTDSFPTGDFLEAVSQLAHSCFDACNKAADVSSEPAPLPRANVLQFPSVFGNLTMEKPGEKDETAEKVDLVSEK